jgi:hypothetical protein
MPRCGSLIQKIIQSETAIQLFFLSFTAEHTHATLRMQFVSEGSGAKTVHAAREESSNPEPPRFAEDGMSLYERLKDNKEKKSVQIDSERVTAGA